ncbi:MAG: TRAP transporter small permease [Denitratisoma sp.]|nr:TRAP transporter small permease [Denitratisoma sp.]
MSKFIYDTSRRMAWFGAFVLALLAAMSVFSIAGRALSFAGLGPVPGDFELVEAGTALAVFCFLPWCHLKRAHAHVAMFWHAYPAALRRFLEILGDALMFGVWLLLVWRMGLAMLEYRENGEVSFILQMPVWWGYAASFVPGVLGCLAYAWRLLETLGLAARPQGFTAEEGAH